MAWTISHPLSIICMAQFRMSRSDTSLLVYFIKLLHKISGELHLSKNYLVEKLFQLNSAENRLWTSAKHTLINGGTRTSDSATLRWSTRGSAMRRWRRRRRGRMPQLATALTRELISPERRNVAAEEARRKRRYCGAVELLAM
jgi:hypothetical protein